MNPKLNFINSLTPSKGVTSSTMTTTPAYAQSKKPVAKTPFTVPKISEASVKAGLEKSGYIQPSSGATSPMPTKVASAPITSSLPPVGQQFAQSLYDSTTGARTPYGASQGVPEMLGGSPVASQSPQLTTPTESPYQKYLASLSEGTTTALSNKEAANKRLADIQSRNEKRSLDARVGYENILDTPGSLKSGAQAMASQFDRRASAESAYGAIEESAAARSAQVANDVYNSYIDAGRTAKEAQDAADRARRESAFTLSEGQTRYEVDPVTGEFKSVGSGIASSESNEMLSPSEAIALGVPYGTTKAQAYGTSTKNMQSGQSDTSKSALGLVDQLLNMDTNAITGIPSLAAFLPGSPAQLTKNTLNQLKSLLSLENRQLLKGSGAISDYEFKVLERAATKLGTNLSNEDFRTVLNEMKRDLSVAPVSSSGSVFAEEW